MRKREHEPSLSGIRAPSIDSLFDILASDRRRCVLYYLYRTDEQVATVDELVEFILEVKGVEGSPEEAYTNVAISLHHVELPRLVEEGVIEFDRRSKTVRYWSQPSLEEWLEHAWYKEHGG